MTFQVALACPDGVVFASDECETRENEGAREAMRRSKIWVVGSDAVMFAGDDWARYAARDICDLLEDKTLTRKNPTRQLRDICKKHYDSIPESDQILRARRREVTAILDGELWQLVIRENGEPTNYKDRVTAGDAMNTARFLTETYYDACVTLEEMKVLAVHAVRMGALRNMTFVRGLGVAVFHRAAGSCRLLEENELDSLSRASKEIHDLTVRQIRQLASGAPPTRPILPSSRESWRVRQP